MSAGGVLFTATVAMEIGEPLEYVITFPSHSGNGGAVNLRCLGKVVRMEGAAPAPNGRASFLVVATLERYEFLREDS
jgi:hypothetical protein